MKHDRIDTLAAELFAAARDEQPDRGLVERVERATSAPTAVSSAAHVRRATVVRGLLAALVCGAGAAVLLLSRTPDGVIISAERSASKGAATPEPRLGADPVKSGDAREALPSASRAPAIAPEGTGKLDGLPSAPLAPAAPADGEAQHDARAAGAAPRSDASSASKTASEPPRPRRMAPRTAEKLPAEKLPIVKLAAEAPAAEAARTPAAAAPATLSNELRLLEQIRQTLRNHDGAGALAMLDRYDTGDYGTRLALEASVLRVEALAAVGRRAEADALARRFVRDNPDSPLAERAQTFIDGAEPARPAPQSPPP